MIWIYIYMDLSLYKFHIDIYIYFAINTYIQKTSILCLKTTLSWLSMLCTRVYAFWQHDKWKKKFLLSSNHLDQATHICVSKPYNFGSDNGLSPVRYHTIIWTNANLLSVGPLATNVSRISMKANICTLKMYFKMPCAKWWPYYRGPPCVNKCTVMAKFLRT